MPQLVKYNIKLVCNAGGLDPVGLKGEIEKLALSLGLNAVKVAAVYGDDILSVHSKLRSVPGAISGYSPFGDVQGDRVESSEGDKFLSVNAYIGAEGISLALDAGATIVVTGRVVDSALALGPCLHAL